MLSATLCWFLGALLLTAGLLTSLYLTWVQIRRGVSAFSLLATSDALATIVISITFLINAAQSQNIDAKISMKPSQCNHGQLTLASALFLAPFVNTFVSMMVHSAESLKSAQNGAEARGQEARKNPRLISSIAAQWILPAISTLLLFSAGVQHSRPYRSNASEICMDGTALTPIPVESTEQCLHQEDISDYITTLMNTHNFTTKQLLINNTQSTSEEVAQVVNNIYKILQIHRNKRSYPVNYLMDKTNQPINIQENLPIQSTRLLSSLHKGDDYYKSVQNFNKITAKTSELENRIKKINMHDSELHKQFSPLQNAHSNKNFYKSTVNIFKDVHILPKLQDRNNQIMNTDKLQGQTSPLVIKHHTRSYNSVHEYPDENKMLKQTYLNKQINNNLEIHQFKNQKNGNYYKTIPMFTNQKEESTRFDHIHQKRPFSLIIFSAHKYHNERYKSNSLEFHKKSSGNKTELQRSPRSSTVENTTKVGDYYDSTDEYYDKEEDEDEDEEEEDAEEDSPKLEEENNSLLETTEAPLEITDSPQPFNTIQPESTSPTVPETESQVPLIPTEPEHPAPTTEESQSEMTTLKETETDLIQIQIPDTINMCIVKCYLSDTFLKKYLFVLLFLCYFIPIIASLTMYFSTPSTQSIVEVKPSTAEESCNMPSSTTLPSTTTNKHSILSSVVMWTPTLVETLLRSWFCVTTPHWLTMLLFVLAQVHAIIRNSINLQLVRKRACGGSVEPLTQSEDMSAKLFTKVKAAILK